MNQFAKTLIETLPARAYTDPALFSKHAVAAIQRWRDAMGDSFE